MANRVREIQRVVFELIAEHGYDAVRVDQIAKAAKTSTATIYRNWRSKSGLTMSLFGQGIVDAADTGSLLGDLHADVDESFSQLSPAIRFLASIALAMRHDAELATAYREHALPVFRHKLDQIVARAVQRGEIQPDAPVLHHLLMLHIAPWMVCDLILDQPLDAKAMHAYIDDVIAPLITQSATTQ